jgi:hypothetical protein
LVSAALAEEVRNRPDLEIVSGPTPLPFDADGHWRSPLSDLA